MSEKKNSVSSEREPVSHYYFANGPWIAGFLFLAYIAFVVTQAFLERWPTVTSLNDSFFWFALGAAIATIGMLCGANALRLLFRPFVIYVDEQLNRNKVYS